jgi:hypothetical protein
VIGKGYDALTLTSACGLSGVLGTSTNQTFRASLQNIEIAQVREGRVMKEATLALRQVVGRRHTTFPRRMIGQP